MFSKNRERLLNEEMAEAFFKRVLAQGKPYLSDGHFAVEGTLIEAWASKKSFRRKGGPRDKPGSGGDADFHGEQRSNQTHESTANANVRL